MRIIWFIIFLGFTSLPFANIVEAASIQQAFKNHQSDVQVQGSGKVIRVLKDDNQGSRHQKFIVKLSSDNTILISHNIDLAPRVNGIAVGDTIEFYGEYEFNNRGGVVHWTHKDPNGRHINGWLKHKGSVYH
ncbi:DUF3465 domain-containing protein [Thalassotalea piscium]